MKLFETERLLVRRFAESDAEYFFQVNGNPEVMRFIRPAKSREESDTFLKENIRFYKDGSTLGRYAVFAKSSGEFVGSFSFLYLSGESDFHIGYALIPEAWGKGYATELVQVGTNYFFEHTDKEAIFAITESKNIASQKVLIKAGYFQKGQLSEHGDKLDLFFMIRTL